MSQKSQRFGRRGRYVVEDPRRDELGAGTYGIVYRVLDTRLNLAVALKTLRPHWATDATVRARFLREAQALSRLDHWNLVAVYEVGDSGEKPYFTMELLEGVTLAELLRRRRRLSVEEATPILQDIAGALDVLHAQRLIHRDLKPSNVMILESDDAVLMDLGIAHRPDDRSLTLTGEILGTPQYMSPEQAAGARDVGKASDIYALGVLAYELLAGVPPFSGDPGGVIAAQIRDAPPSLERVRPRLPPAVLHAIEQALAKAPGQRPVSGAQFMRLFAGGAEARPTPQPRHNEARGNRPPRPRRYRRPEQDGQRQADEATAQRTVPIERRPTSEPAAARHTTRGRTFRWLIAALLLLLAVVLSYGLIHPGVPALPWSGIG